jgi:hypothetical protein
MVDSVELICGKCEGVQRPAEVAARARTATGYKDGTRNNGGGSGQEPPSYSREYGGAALTAVDTEAAAAGAAVIAATSRRCHSILSIDLHKESGNYWMLHLHHPNIFLMSAYSCIVLQKIYQFVGPP